MADLPAPVQRFFRAALTEGQPLVTAVRIEHTGTFNMSESREQWKPFTSRHIGDGNAWKAEVGVGESQEASEAVTGAWV